MRAHHALPEHLAAALKRETSDDAVRWYGRPNPSQAFWRTTPIWLFAIPWTVFSGYMMLGLAAAMIFAKVPPNAAGKIDAFIPVMGWIGVLFMVPFVVIGLAMMISPFWVWSVSRNTVYAVTDRRVLTIATGRTTKITAIDLRSIQMTERSERVDGSGTLKLVIGHGRDSDGDAVEKKHDLFAIPEVRNVAALIDGLRAKSGRG